MGGATCKMQAVGNMFTTEQAGLSRRALGLLAQWGPALQSLWRVWINGGIGTEIEVSEQNPYKLPMWTQNVPFSCDMHPTTRRMPGARAPVGLL